MTESCCSDDGADGLRKLASKLRRCFELYTLRMHLIPHCEAKIFAEKIVRVAEGITELLPVVRSRRPPWLRFWGDYLPLIRYIMLFLSLLLGDVALVDCNGPLKPLPAHLCLQLHCRFGELLWCESRVLEPLLMRVHDPFVIRAWQQVDSVVGCIRQHVCFGAF